MDIDKITFNDWAKTRYDEIGSLKEFQNNTREKMYGLMKHVLGIKESADSDQKGTIIGYKRLALKCNGWANPAEAMAFYWFEKEKLGTMKRFADEYEKLRQMNLESDVNEDAKSIKQLAEEFKEALGKDFFDSLIYVSDVELMQLVLKYVEIMWDDADMTGEMTGNDVLDEIRAKTGWDTEVISDAVSSGKIREIKAIINEAQQLEKNREKINNKLESIGTNDIIGKEGLEKKKNATNDIEARLKKRYQKIVRELEDFPQGAEPWFSELNSDDEELFDMLYENASAISAEHWEKLDREELVSLIRKSFEDGNLSKIEQYFDVDEIEMRIMYPDLWGMEEIEKWSASFCPRKIQELMKSIDGVCQDKTETAEHGQALLKLGDAIIQRKSELSCLVKEAQKMIGQYEKHEKALWSYSACEDFSDFESKIYEIIDRQYEKE